MTYNITNHCKDRYVERVLGNSNSSKNIFVEMIKDLSTAKNITSTLSEKYPRFILYVKERYGKDIGFNFLQKDKTIFVLTKRKGTVKLYDVLTCYIESGTIAKFANTKLTHEQIYTKLSLLKNEKRR